MKYQLNVKKLKQLMLDREIDSMVQLSKETGVSRTTIYEFLNGSSPFSKSFLRICDCLQSTPGELIEKIAEEDENEN